MERDWNEDVPASSKGEVREPDAREVFVAWEKYRLLYNGVLAVVTLLLGGPFLLRPDFLIYGFMGMLGANLLFCLGMWAEGYADLFGLRREPARLLLFGLGTAIGVCLTAAAVLSFRVASNQ